MIQSMFSKHDLLWNALEKYSTGSTAGDVVGGRAFADHVQAMGSMPSTVKTHRQDWSQ